MSNKQTHRKVWLEFLGSMNLAITILVALSIASIIGTVLQQNQPYTNYIIKFGPFWHEIFRALDLYDVYGSVWFLVLLGFLVLTTSVCIYRNAPVMLKDMKHFRLNVQEKSLRVLHNFNQWTLSEPTDQTEQRVDQILSSRGYKLRRKQDGENIVLAAMKGGMNRMGYILTHTGIIVICIGGLIDGNLPLSVKEWTGKLKVETRDIAAKDVPQISRLKPSDSASFRGSVTIPEGSGSNLVFLNVRDGYLIQELPFAVELKDFRIEHYQSGQPKSFESDLIIHDDQLEEPLKKTIAVNHPLVYRGYNIYQASFADGGSVLQIAARPLFNKNQKSLPLEGKVNSVKQLETINGMLSIELNDFKLFNIFPAEKNDPSGKKFKNFGPSFTFKVRDEDGQAREYVNYMSPVMQEGRYFYLSGMRRSNADQFKYLHIPADSEGSMERFFKFHAMLNDTQRVRQTAEQSVDIALKASKLPDASMRDEIIASMVRLVGLFNQGGYIAIDKDIRDKVPADRQVKVAEAYLKILQNMLQGLYLNLLNSEGVDISKGISPEDNRFFEDAVNGLAGLGAYGTPFYLQLTSFEHRQASGLQITRSPGKNIVYFGCLILIIGIFMMFYIAHQRLWIILKPADNGTEVLLGGAGNRNQRDFAQQFEKLVNLFNRHLP
ncbi:MAG: cytochrome c biogenesis protein ResB [Gammaproteobacteria bacterium]